MQTNEQRVRRYRPHAAHAAEWHIDSPTVIAGRVSCPRCETRLRFDGAELYCVTCGYEHELTPDLSRLPVFSRRLRPVTTTAG